MQLRLLLSWKSRRILLIIGGWSRIELVVIDLTLRLSQQNTERRYGMWDL